MLIRMKNPRREGRLLKACAAGAEIETSIGEEVVVEKIAVEEEEGTLQKRAFVTAETKVEVASAAGAWSYLQFVTQVEGKADAAAEGEMCPEIEAETVDGEKTQIEGVTEIESEAETETETRAEIVEPETETGGRSEVRGNEAGSDTKASNAEGELLAVQSDRDLLATTAAAAAAAGAGAAQRTLLARSSPA